MRVSELKRVLEVIEERVKKERGKIEDIPVYITLAEKSVGPRAYTRVSYMGLGYDWEKGQLRIEPEERLVRLGRSVEDVMQPRMTEYEGRTYLFCRRCASRVYKTNNYCSSCGQRLK